MQIKGAVHVTITVHPQHERCNQYAKGELLVSCSARYPMLAASYAGEAAARINAQYRILARDMCARCAGWLRQEALADYIDKKQNEFPFNPYDSTVNYSVQLNQDCVISLLLDRYEFTGGAHGNTQRSADTWIVTQGRRMTLGELFPDEPAHQEKIIQFIQQQIGRAADEYFDDSMQLAIDAFSTDQFYLTPEGVTIFYQQYDIAPYAAGIPEFTIPWGTLGATRPSCL